MRPTRDARIAPTNPRLQAMPWVDQHWFKEAVVDALVGRTFASDIVSGHFGPANKSALCRILTHAGVAPSGDLMSIVGDGTHMMVAWVPFATVCEYERRMHERITYRTQGTVVEVKHARLRVARRGRFAEMLGLSEEQLVKRFGFLPAEFVYLELLQFDIFHRDQADPHARHRYLYYDRTYRHAMAGDALPFGELDAVSQT